MPRFQNESSCENLSSENEFDSHKAGVHMNMSEI